MTSKKKYNSQYGAGLITDAAYLVEYLAQRVALKEKKNLPVKFWNTPQWKKWFQWQIVAANALLDEGLTCVQIMAFLRSKPGQKILSLGQKKPILEGASKLQVVHIVTGEDDQFTNNLDDIIVDDTEEENINTKSTLWEKLQ